jgi:hypothetical protein
MNNELQIDVAQLQRMVRDAEQRADSAEQRADSAEQRAALAEQRADSAEQRTALAEQRVALAEEHASEAVLVATKLLFINKRYVDALRCSRLLIKINERRWKHVFENAHHDVFPTELVALLQVGGPHAQQGCRGARVSNEPMAHENAAGLVRHEPRSLQIVLYTRYHDTMEHGSTM